MEIQIIPIFLDKDFKGNGVVFGTHLISPYHVINLSQSFNYKIFYQNEFYNLRMRDYLYHEYEPNSVDDKRKDLIIFKFPFCEIQGISYGEVNEQINAVIGGYNIIKEEKEENEKPTFIQCNVNTIHNWGYQYPEYGNPIRQDNVFEFYSEYKLEEGMSGSPIYDKDNFYGILLSNLNGLIEYPYTALKASYIFKILQELHNK